MRASEAFAVSDRIARDVPGETPEVGICCDGEVKHFFGITTIRNCLLDEVDKYLKGDDWQPLYPAVDISELPRCRGNRNFIHVDDLRKVAIRDTEREKELEAKVRELESKLESLASDKKYLQDVRNDLQAELSTLREQSKRNCYTLGESLEPGTHVDKNTPLFKFSGEQWWPCMWGMDIVIPARCHGEYYLDPRPLPTLPDPEESRLVKRLKSLQRRASGSYDDHVRVDSGTLAQVLKEMEKPKE